jgi:tRNA (guanine-N7-)-methyltransferase
LARAAGFPHVNFLGIERMLRRVRKVDRKVQRLGLSNVRLLRIEAYYAVAFLMPPQAISAYYLFFPDPWPKRRHHGHRLFSPPFMDALARTIVPGGMLHIATDDASYFEQIDTWVNQDHRFSPSETFIPSSDERTDFERYFDDQRRICRVSVERRQEISAERSSCVGR